MFANGRHSVLTSSLKFQMNCHDCSLSRLCLPGCLQNNEVDQLENIIKRNHPLHKGEHLFRAGEPMQQVYALRSGALKTYLLDPDGNEQITGFTLPGELVGLDAFGNSSFPSYAVALETSLVCTIPLADLEELAGHIPSLRKQLLVTLSRELQEEQQHYSHNRESAERRLAVFLLNLSLRYSRRSLSATSFILSMSRGEIGNYLGLTTETVSRLFSRFRRQGLLEIKGRELRLMHPTALNQLGRIEVRQLAV
ncbi:MULTISPECIES: fumarate/nitrate reduction transcriptional regulator Fnr [unclassified Pseudomonas]|nr:MULTISPECIES: fumarate/nitrate reduction transcriptional regulator Fnr [unclassified Pseudomonas]